MDDLLGFAMNLVAKNPKLAGNHQEQQLIYVIQRGEEIVDKLCKTFGTTREQAVSDAMDEENDRAGYTHELGHYVIYSFGLACDIHKMFRQEYWIEAE